MAYLHPHKNLLISLVKDLISTSSISGTEKKIMKFGFSWSKENHLRVIEQKYKNLNNIICVAGRGEKTTVLTTHLDTVEPEPRLWKRTKPHSPRIMGGKLYGLGASDAKGIASAMLWTAASFHKSAEARKGRVVVVLVSDEERTGKGSEVVIPFLKKHSLLRIAPKSTAVIVGEPTNLTEIGLGSRGNVFITVTIYGKSVHSSRPMDGKNAAQKAASIISRLPDFVESLNREYPDVILSGTDMTVTSLFSNLGILKGSIIPMRLNTLPGEAHFTLDCRLSQPYFQNNFQSFWKRFNKFMVDQNEPGFKLAWSKVYPEVAGHAIKQSHSLVQLLTRAISMETGKKPSYRIAMGANDAPFWARAGFEVVNEYGPGNSKIIHQPDEWINLSQLEKGARIYLSFAKMWSNRT